MKKIIYTLAALVFLTACGSKKEENKEGGTDSTATEVKEEGVKEDASIINPAKDDLSKIFSTTQLIQSMRAPVNKEMQLVVYPFVYTTGEKCQQGMSASAVGDKDDKNVTITFTAVPDLAITKGKPYVVKGKLSGIGYWQELQMTDCTLEELKGEAKTEAYNPKAISAKAMYNPKEIIDNIMAWDKKVVTVNGDYWGTTTSKSSDGKKLLEERVDLQLTGDELKVGCGFEVEGAAKELQPGQKNVTIKGELDAVKSLAYGPCLVKCEIVK